MSTQPLQDRHNAAGKVAVAGTVLLILAIAALGVMPGSYQTLLRQSFQAIGHFVFFGGLALLAAMAAPYVIPGVKNQRWAQYAIGLLVSIGAGVTLEVGQAFIPGRSATLGDLRDDALGASAAILLLFTVHHARRSGLGWRLAQLAACAASLALFSISAGPFVLCWLDYQERAKALPAIIKLNERWADRFWYVDTTVTIEPSERPEDWPTDAPDDYVKMTIYPGEKYPGLTIYEPVADWRPYLAFAFDIYSPMPDPIPLQLRIHDRDHNQDYHDRFNRSLTIEPGFQTVSVSIDDIQQGPRHRQLDLSRVMGFMLFVVEPQEEIELYIGNFRFE